MRTAKGNRGYRADRARSYSDIEKVAAQARKFALPELETDARVNPIRFFEALPDCGSVRLESGRALRIEGAVKDLPAGVMAQASHEDGVLVVALSVETYELVERCDPRATFTVAHEFGHVLLHAPELVRLSLIPHSQEALMRGRADHPRFQDTEWQANAFAAAFLSPAAGLLALERALGRALLPSDLQNQFGLSYQAAGYRVQNWNERRRSLVLAAQHG